MTQISFYFRKHGLLFLILSLCSGCAPSLAYRHAFLATYQHGDLPLAEQTISKAIEKEMPSEDFRQSNNAVWMLLDRATTRFVESEIDCAVEDYQLAIEALDYYNQDSSAELIGKTLLQDDVGAYQAADYEQVLARVYFALALLHKGDTSNAFAILRQAEELQQKKRAVYASIPYTKDYQLIDNTVAKYLFAALLENRGDSSNAKIIYAQMAQLLGLPNLVGQKAPSSEAATVIVLCHNGNVPIKISDFSDASAASAIALEMILSSHRIRPAISSCVGIAVPVLTQSIASIPQPTLACIDGVSQFLAPLHDVALTAAQQLEQEKPVIVARGVARYLLRRSTVACLQEQDPGLGALADIGMLIANANTQADTRSWSTLPSSIDLARYEVHPGSHSLSIQVRPVGLPILQQDYQLQLEAHDFCIINVFNLHPGITTVLIPERFLYKGVSI
jgi:uncharacterized protein